MKRLVTAQQIRELDRAAAERHGLPSSVLMENAGSALAEEALRLLGPDGQVLILCGHGNNGGDGLVAARKLAQRGRPVRVEVVGDSARLEGEPERNLRALHAVGMQPSRISDDLHASSGDVVIDALLGTGLSRAPDGAYADAIDRIAAWRAQGAKVLAADLPSGLHADSGRPFKPCVQADVTLSFGLLKIGQALEPGVSWCGQTREVDIGIPAGATQLLGLPGVFLLEEDDAKNRLPARSPDAHKGTFGHVLAVAGSWGKTGAAALTGIAALRGGAGLVTVATRPEALVPVMAHAPELMGLELVSDGGLGLGDLNSLLEACDGKRALAIGPGIPHGEETGKLLGALLEELSIPCVLDADALNALAGTPDALEKAKSPCVITPHPGEAARLLGSSPQDVQADRLGAARALASAHRVVVVLKGARTVIALPDGTTYVNPTGNVGMATAGSGDVLTGVVAALLAQGLSTTDAAIVGVYAHGLAADLSVLRTGKLGLVASDLFGGLCEVWTRWTR